MALISAHRPAADWLKDLNKAKVGCDVANCCIFVLIIDG